ncbi:serine/threonine-protein phosphatase [Streptomyces sp. A3M-1-3]|uniref:PP2C family protein-serine/threonine phosphatase n=1 Tax=Streptomyces sp. A3M-1-3 TaxID=2962044 RepID=UPI0020B8FD72|nr:PP2C family protein-serine/threonine phosphatase [Streptomyces sp. A3M-1-3]MCP3817459.1 serine/threonine-protein phosphatase [Streptomyces sp. A3M-1-3]
MDRMDEEPGWRRGAPPPRWVRVLPIVLLIGLSAARIATPRTVELGYFLAALPPVAAFAYGAVGTALFGGVTLILLAVPAIEVGRAGSGDLVTVAFVALLSVVIAWVRQHRDAQLVSVRTMAEAAQLAVLPPLPEQVGPVRCAGLYRAAQRGTLVGGDLYDVREGPYGVRALVGDVQGHGLAAVGTVAALLGAFREAVLDDPGLGAVAARLDRRLVADSAGVEHAELFATAVLLEFPPDAPVVRIVSCGHPAPLLLRGASATELDAEPGAPLGLGLAGLAGPAGPRVASVRLEPGDRVLVHTDGVTEARDAAGAFYPLEERLPVLSAEFETDPAALATALWRDLSRFAGAVADDVALLVLSPGVTSAAAAPATAAQ